MSRFTPATSAVWLSISTHALMPSSSSRADGAGMRSPSIWNKMELLAHPSGGMQEGRLRLFSEGKHSVGRESTLSGQGAQASTPSRAAPAHSCSRKEAIFSAVAPTRSSNLSHPPQVEAPAPDVMARDLGNFGRIAMAARTVLVEVDGRTTRLTLNRPDRLNSFNTEMHEALAAALDEAGAH